MERVSANQSRMLYQIYKLAGATNIKETVFIHQLDDLAT